MKIILNVRKAFEVKFLKAICGVRYWEDTSVNGIEDEKGDLMPCRDGENWAPLIEIETGKIINWEIGKTALVNYKVCDAGCYKLLDINKQLIVDYEGYVPEMMDPKKDGFGDYVIMAINENGIIKDWEANFNEFTK